MALTDKQERFCQEYVIDSNGTQAAIRAGYSPDTAMEQASRLLRNVKVSERVDQLREEIKKRNQITVDELVTRLANIARFDIKELYDEEGTLKLPADIEPEHREAILGIDSEEKVIGKKDGEDGYDSVKAIVATRKVKIMNKLDAIEKLMKHLGGYEKDNRQKQPTIIVKPADGCEPLPDND